MASQHAPLRILLIFSIISFCSFHATPCHADIWSGLVGWWKFDEASSGTCAGATVVDASNHGNTGTCTGSPTYGTGKIGQGAMSLDGVTQYVTIGQQAVLAPALISVSAWVKPVAVTGYADGASIAEYSDSRHWMQGYALYLYGGSVYFGLGNGTTYFRSASSTVSAGSWVHLVGVFDGNNAYLYINGALVSTQNGVSVTYNATNTFTIGHGSGNASFVNGSIDDVRVYNRALSAADVSMLYLYGTVTLRNSTWKNFKTY